jgi:hypothetical protein
MTYSLERMKYWLAYASTDPNIPLLRSQSQTAAPMGYIERGLLITRNLAASKSGCIDLRHKSRSTGKLLQQRKVIGPRGARTGIWA